MDTISLKMPKCFKTLIITGIQNNDDGNITLTTIADSVDRPVSLIIDEDSIATSIIDEGQNPYGVIDED